MQHFSTCGWLVVVVIGCHQLVVGWLFPHVVGWLVVVKSTSKLSKHSCYWALAQETMSHPLDRPSYRPLGVLDSPMEFLNHGIQIR